MRMSLIFTATLMFLAVGIPCCKSRKWIPSYAGPYQIVLVSPIKNVSDEYPVSLGKLWLQLYVTHPRGREVQYGWGHSLLSESVTNDMKTSVREVKNHSLAFEFKQFPVMPYGRYLFTVAVLSGKEVMGVAVTDVLLEPKV